MDKQNSFDTQPLPSSIEPSQQDNLVEDKKVSSALPPDRQTNSDKNTKGCFYLGSFIEQRTEVLVHLLGYGLLLFALCDYLHIVIPPRLTDPVWEFQTIGALVEHVAIPLLGLLFVFYRYQGYIREFERKLLGLLSWTALLLGLLYLFMVPLGVTDTWRLYQRNQAEISAQVLQQNQQFQQIKGQLSQAKTDRQIEQLAASLTSQRTPQVKNPQEFKNQLLTQVSQAEQNIQAQARNVQQNQKISLLKNSVKWNLGALIAATLLLSIWHHTRWARKSRSK